MGQVILDNGSKVSFVELEGSLPIQELYDNAMNKHYTEGYRVDCIKSCGKIGRGAWGILMYLHDLIKENDRAWPEVVEAAKVAIKQIDPGMPILPSNEKWYNTLNMPQITTPVKVVDKTLDKMFPRQTNTGVIQTKLELKKVTITDLEVENDDLASGTRVYCTCNFCEKTTILSKNILSFNKNVIGDGKIFCTTCLRYNLHRPRLNRNTLMLTYRGLIGYYYNCFHLIKTPSMQLHELQGYIDLHVKFGQQNPLFHYDPETYTWFIDFSRVGSGAKRVPVEFVLETIVQQVAAFCLYENVKDSSPVAFYNKFKEAIFDFLHHRKRPVGQKTLCPTLYGCGIPHETSLNKAIPNESLKKFMAANLIDSYKLKQSKSCY